MWDIFIALLSPHDSILTFQNPIYKKNHIRLQSKKSQRNTNFKICAFSWEYICK